MGTNASSRTMVSTRHREPWYQCVIAHHGYQRTIENHAREIHFGLHHAINKAGDFDPTERNDAQQRMSPPIWYTNRWSTLKGSDKVTENVVEYIRCRRQRAHLPRDHRLEPFLTIQRVPKSQIAHFASNFFTFP